MNLVYTLASKQPEHYTYLTPITFCRLRTARGIAHLAMWR
jgi:hypothetical protein